MAVPTRLALVRPSSGHLVPPDLCARRRRSPEHFCCVLCCHRGLRTALIEREDWAAGTSSRSTKLVHGGVRYLEKVNRAGDAFTYAA